MSFICKFQLNNGELDESEKVIFIEYIESSFGSFHHEPVRIAKVHFNGVETYIYSTCWCFPSRKANLTSGQKIDKDTILGYFAAEGEGIPYGKSYARIDRKV